MNVGNATPAAIVSSTVGHSGPLHRRVGGSAGAAHVLIYISCVLRSVTVRLVTTQRTQSESRAHDERPSGLWDGWGRGTHLVSQGIGPMSSGIVDPGPLFGP